jgi:DNA polymerase family A
MIAEEYVRHELFDCYLVSVSDGKNAWAGHPKDLNWKALEGAHLISHNAYFDRTVYGELLRRKLAPDIHPTRWDCTANLTSFLCNRRALQQSVEHLFGVKVSKDYRDVADGKNWPKDYSETERQQIIAAGMSDATYCWRLWDQFSPKWPELEQRLSNLTIEQGMRGVQIDTELLDKYLIASHDMLRATEKIIPWLKEAEDDDTWDDFNVKPTATKCIAEQCRRIGIPCPPVKSKDEEGYEDWETLHAPKHPWILAVGAWRSINKLYKTFQTVKRRLRADGTLPFGLKYFGAHTGRWSGEAGINFQNMRKVPVFANELGLMETNELKIADTMKFRKKHKQWPDWVRAAIDFRNLIVPRPGKKMIISDLSQIEPRVLAWLGGNTAFLDLVRQGVSVYEAFARSSMGYTGEKMDKDSSYYTNVKIQVLGLGYGAGWEKFIKLALQNGVDLCAQDPEFIEELDPTIGEIRQVAGYGATSKKIVENFRAASPHITALWKKLDDAFKRSIGEDFVMTLPSGRKMTYEKVAAAVRITKDPKTGKPKKKYEFTAIVGGRRKTFYGGKLCENITQAAARDVFGTHLVQMDKNGWTNLFSSHDEGILEVDQSVTARDIEITMSVTPEWMPGLPVAAEAKEVSHYLK